MKRFEMYKALTKELDTVKKPLIALGVFKIWNMICDIIPLFLYSSLINNVLVVKDINALWPVVSGYLAVFLLATVGIVRSKKFSNQLILKYDLGIKNKLLKKFMSIDDNGGSVGDVKNRIENDSAIAGNFFITHILDFVYAVVYAVLLGIVLIWYDWKIALISFVFIPVAFMVVNFLGSKTKKTAEELRLLQVKYETFLHSTFQNWKDIKINNLEDAKYDELNEYYKKIRRVWFLDQFYLHMGITFSFFSKNFITQLFIYFIGGIFVINGYSQVSVLLIFIRFYGQFFECIQKIGNSMMNFKKDSVNIEKAIESLEMTINNRPYKKIEGADIAVNNLKFSYGEEAEFTIEQLSFSVNKG